MGSVENSVVDSSVGWTLVDSSVGWTLVDSSVGWFVGWSPVVVSGFFSIIVDSSVCFVVLAVVPEIKVALNLKKNSCNWLF